MENKLVWLLQTFSPKILETRQFNFGIKAKKAKFDFCILTQQHNTIKYNFKET